MAVIASIAFGYPIRLQLVPSRDKSNLEYRGIAEDESTELQDMCNTSCMFGTEDTRSSDMSM